MKRLALLLCLVLLLGGCAPESDADLAQEVRQTLDAQNIAYEPMDLWQTEEVPAYDYRGGELYRSEAQHTLVFTAGNCLGILRVEGRETVFFPLEERPALIMGNCYRNDTQVALLFTAEGCSLQWSERLLYAFDAPDEALEAIGKKALLGLARQQEGHAVRFGRHLRASTPPEVPTLPPETPEDIPALVRTAAPYGAYDLAEQDTASELFWITCEIPHYVYSGGTLSLQETQYEVRWLFCGENLVGEVYWYAEGLQAVKNGEPFQLHTFSSQKRPDRTNLAAKMERFFRSGDSIAIVSAESSAGLLVINGTVLPISETVSYPYVVEKVQSAVDTQGLTHAKAQKVFSFHAATETQYYDEPWPPELNRGPEEPAVWQ